MRPKWTPGWSGCFSAECAFVGLSQPRVISKVSPIIFTTNIHGLHTLLFAVCTLKSVSSAIFPSRGRPGRETGTRELILTGLPYVIVFRSGEQLVEILRIYHGAQNWK